MLARGDSRREDMYFADEQQQSRLTERSTRICLSRSSSKSSARSGKLPRRTQRTTPNRAIISLLFMGWQGSQYVPFSLSTFVPFTPLSLLSSVLLQMYGRQPELQVNEQIELRCMKLSSPCASQ